MLYTKILQILCRLKKSMLIGLNSSLILKLHDSELQYEELTKCSKWILNMINNVNRQIIFSLCFVGIQVLRFS